MPDSAARVADCAECDSPAEAPFTRLTDPFGQPTSRVVCLDCRGLILAATPAREDG